VTITPNSSGEYGNSTNRLLLHYMKLLGRGYASYADCLRLLCVSKSLHRYGCSWTENFHSFQNCKRASFLIESQKVYVTNLYDNLGCPSNNSRFRNVVSRSPIYTSTHNKKFWVILEL